MRRVAFLLLGVVALAPAARARPTYPDYIPAAPVDGRCGTCHVDPMGGGARNSFGTDVEATIMDDGPDWSSLFCMDSDGDGRTNGQELGDPCGAWTAGSDPLRTEPVSAPGDPNDVVDVSDGAVCDGDAPPTCASATSAAGCGQAGPSSAWLTLALVCLTRRLKSRGIAQLSV